MIKLRIQGVYVFAIGLVAALTMAFHWRNFIAYTLLLGLSLVYLRFTGLGINVPTLRSCLMNLLSIAALGVMVILVGTVLFQAGQQLKIPDDQLIYLIPGGFCLAGLGIFIWSFRAAMDPARRAIYPQRPKRYTHEKQDKL